jgi:PAS domain S-box-containing protein
VANARRYNRTFHGSEYAMTDEGPFRNLIEKSRDGFIVLDEQDTIRYVNPAAEKLFGRAVTELVGKHFHIHIPPETPSEIDILHRCSASGDQIELRTVSCLLTFSEWEGGKARLINLRDLTEGKRNMARIERLDASLAIMEEDLQQFAYVASHDLQEPLRMVTSFTQLLEERYGEMLDEKGRQYIAYAVDGARRMQRLILDLLSFSRIQTHGRPFAAVDMEKAFLQSLRDLKLQVDNENASVTCDPLPVIQADGHQVRLVWHHLLDNALKFRQESTPRIHVSAQKRENGWCFRMRDNGIGIDPRFRDKVFVLFQRLHGREEYPGTGIGLALCKKVITRHGGRIWFEPGPGEGTDFCFVLPEHSQTPVPPTPSFPTGRQGG